MTKVCKIRVAMEMAYSASKLSHDSETKVGSVLITEDGSLVSSGYNGFVRHAPDDQLPTTRPDKYVYIVHSEVNLIANCARKGISTNNCYVVCTMSPCVSCMRMLYQSGVKKVYCDNLYKDFADLQNMKDIHIKQTWYPYKDGSGGCWELEYEPIGNRSESK